MNTLARPALTLALALLLGGCGMVPKKSEISIYDPQPASQIDPAWPAADARLLIQRPNADRLIDSSRIVVRPSPGELQVYRGALWIQPAPDMLREALLRNLADSGKLSAGAARRGDGLSGQYELALDIRRFDADYAGNTLPAAVVEVSARIIDTQQGQIIAQQIFRSQQPASDSQVGEVANAFNRALAEVSRDITGWSLGHLQQRR